ncbi:MAG: YihA family ribosome biogenesis GTP-binding protein [Alphaproteobacteria bacterium PRO2]|nr:YihA family ribosome biogenesis GTP-binding protein [Alphaproteobacteria bacterium PRO2]
MLTPSEHLFAGPCDFIWGAASADNLPDATLSEIAFAGRSNVGKSSLINALTNRKDLARTSNTPGRTQQLNFFKIRDKFLLVDMPGYGYAKVSKAKKAEWDELIFDYLRGRQTLRCVLLLIDSRHGFKDVDRELMKMMDAAAVAYRVVLTKSDKADDLAGMIETIKAELKTRTAAHPEPLLTSAEEKTGIAELRETIAALI